jgi:hypothetical protein
MGSLFCLQLETSGFDVSGWKQSSSKKSPRTARDIPLEERAALGGASAMSSLAEKDIPATSSNFSTFLLCIVVTLICCNTIQTVMTKPIPTNVVLPPGTIKTKCGLAGFVPEVVKDVTKTLLEPFVSDIHQKSDSLLNCKNKLLEVSSNGEVTITDAQGNVDMVLKGGACGSGEGKDCVNGLVLQENKMLKMGTKVIKTGTLYYDASPADHKLSPWPFDEEPKLKLKAIRRK